MNEWMNKLSSSLMNSEFQESRREGLFGCEPISMEWSPRWATFLADGLPFRILHLPQVLLIWPSLGWERFWVAVSWRGYSYIRGFSYISLQNEWMNEWTSWYLQNDIYFAKTEFSSYSTPCRRLFSSPPVDENIGGKCEWARFLGSAWRRGTWQPPWHADDTIATMPRAVSAAAKERGERGERGEVVADGGVK